MIEQLGRIILDYDAVKLDRRGTVFPDLRPVWDTLNRALDFAIKVGPQSTDMLLAAEFIGSVHDDLAAHWEGIRDVIQEAIEERTKLVP
jgi:hypothetical protein